MSMVLVSRLKSSNVSRMILASRALLDRVNSSLPETASPALIGWRTSPGAKLQYTGVSQRTLGQAGAEAFRNAIFTARPDLQQQRSAESSLR
ncbi:hypothetical protein [Rhizobium leguminosarum]|uniref:hypothetical protein n=1 Tax=Rhizobium leguminosarum TaxID=384 RepID=UPI0013F1640A|nr:hypothetical protein [Rhizobium leguminosarum]